MQNESLNALMAPSPSLVSNSRGPLLVSYPLRPEKHRHTELPGAHWQPARAGASQGAECSLGSTISTKGRGTYRPCDDTPAMSSISMSPRKGR